MIVLAPVLTTIALLAPAQQDVAGARFERMKALVGTWPPADRPASRLRIRFSLTAGGTALVEEWLNAGKPHSMTVYHRDGGRLIATHYCPQGNQPRLVSTPREGERGSAFVFLDATNLAAGETYLVALSFDLSDPDTLIRRETYRSGRAEEPSELRLVRAG